MKLTGRKKEVGGQTIYEAEEVCGGNKGREKKKANEEKGNDKLQSRAKRASHNFGFQQAKTQKGKKKRTVKYSQVIDCNGL